MFWPSKQQVRCAFLVLVCISAVAIVYFDLRFDARSRRRDGMVLWKLGNMSRLKEMISEGRSGGNDIVEVNTTSCCLNTSTIPRVMVPDARKIYSGANIRSRASPKRQEDSNGIFQPINDHLIYVYSAFFDKGDKDGPVIVVIGISLRSRIPIYCHMHEMGHVSITTGRMAAFPDSHSKSTRFAAEYFHCRLRGGSRPQFVSLTTSSTEKATNKLEVIYPGRRLRNITVCHPAMYGPYIQQSQLIQSIEINRALGAEHIFIYNYSVSEETNFILRQYEADGVLTILQWHLPTGTDAWYHGQIATINDCVYRNRNVSDYVVIIDLDEFIIPVNTTSWGNLIQDINNDYYGDNKQNKPPLGSMGFESCLFYRKPAQGVWKQITTNFSITKEEEDVIQDNSILPFLYLDRSGPPFTFPKRSKAINRPELVFKAGIHFIASHHENVRTIVVSSDKAIVNHYSSTFMRVSNTVTDVSVLRLKHILLPRLLRAFTRFKVILHKQTPH